MKVSSYLYMLIRVDLVVKDSMLRTYSCEKRGKPKKRVCPYCGAVFSYDALYKHKKISDTAGSNGQIKGCLLLLIGRFHQSISRKHSECNFTYS